MKITRGLCELAIEYFINEAVKTEASFYNQQGSLNIRLADLAHKQSLKMTRARNGAEPLTDEEYKAVAARAEEIKTRQEKVWSAKPRPESLTYPSWKLRNQIKF